MPDPETTPEPSPEQQPYEPASEPSEPDCSSFPPPGECSTDVDDLTCIANGDAAKAEYNKTFAEKLKTAKQAYATTRDLYRTERDKQRQVVEDLRNQIRHLVERIGCQIEQKRVRKCLDDAFCDVLDELKCCPSDDGCCVGDCEFPLVDIDKLSVEELAALITAYQAKTNEAEKCFTKLRDEPTELSKRVQEVKDAVAKINEALGGDAATLNLKKVYADALVAQWKIGRVWGGFPKRQDFVDCLCDALTCWTKGCDAVYKLTGAKAIAECKDQAKKDRCELLRTKMSEQILAGYDRHCAKSNCEDPSDGGEEPENDNDDEHDKDDGEDCGCHKHHGHRQRRHDCGCHHGDCGCHHHTGDS